MCAAAKSKGNPFEGLTDDHLAMTLIRNGLPARRVARFIRHSGLSQRDVLQATRLKSSTFYSRLKNQSSFKEETANKLVRLMRIYKLAEDTLGNPDLAVDWLKSANPALAGETPLSLLDTEPGAREVENLLLRIEHGLYG